MAGLRLLLHAPTAESLTRARSNARNLLGDRPDAEVLIVANAAGARAAIETREPETDSLLLVCENSLRAQGLSAGPLTTVPAAVVLLAERQGEGWVYIRA